MNIAIPFDFAPNTKAKSADVDANFQEIATKFNTYAVQTDVSKTITASQTMAADLLFSDALYDIGKSGATRPRDLFLSRNLRVGGQIFGIWANGPVRVTDYGAIGNGVADEITAFNAAHDALPITGGIIEIPWTATNIWYLSDTWHFTKPIHLKGQIATQSALIAPTGTLLLIAADKTGIQLEGNDTFGDTLVAPRGSAANYAIIEGISLKSKGGSTGLLAGGTGVACHAIRCRTVQPTIRNCFIQDFHGDGIRIWASTGSVDPTLKGNVNCWQVDHVWINNCSGGGLNVFGTDVNAGVATVVTAFGCDRGFWDQSFLGNTYIGCNTASSITRCYEVTGATNNTLLLGCYSEYTGEPHALVNRPAIIIGGQLAGEGAIDPASTAPVWSGTVMTRGSIQHINRRAAVSIGMSFGYDTNGMYAFKWGSSDDLVTMDTLGYRYDPVTGWWILDHKSSGSRIEMELPTDVIAAPRAWTASFRNGVYLGSARDTGILMTISTGAPGAIALNRGDVLWESLPGINKPFFRVNTSAGSPGTVVPGPVLDVFSGDRGDNSVTLVFPTDCRHQRFNTALTVARSVTLPAAAANLTGVSYVIVRELAATGAFNLDIKNSAGTTIKSLTAAGQWALVLCDGATFRAMESGTQLP